MQHRIAAIIFGAILAISPMLIINGNASHRGVQNLDEEALLHDISLPSGESISINFSSRAGGFWVDADCGGDCRDLLLTVSDSVSENTAVITANAVASGQLAEGVAWLNLSNTGSDQLNIDIQASLPELNSLGNADSSSSRNAAVQARSFLSISDLAEIVATKTTRGGIHDPSATWVNATFNGIDSMYWLVDANVSDILELSLLHSSADVELRLLSGDEGNQVLASLSSQSNSSSSTIPQRFWQTTTNNHTWLEASTATANSSFSARLAAHGGSDTWPATGEINDVQELHEESATFYGLLSTSDEEIIMLNASGPHLWQFTSSSTTALDVNISAMVDGIWVPFLTFQSLQSDSTHNSDSSIWTPEATALLKVSISSVNEQTGIWSFNVMRTTFGDIGNGVDANGAIPMNIDSAMENWDFIQLKEGVSHTGWLSLPAYDGADTYLLNLEGWEESRYRIKLQLTADNTRVVAELIEMDWSSRTIVSNSSTIVEDGIQGMATLEVGEGTHLLRIRSVELMNRGGNWTWGDVSVSPIPWTIEISVIQSEEGIEPWFKAEGFVSQASTALLYFLGFLMLTPIIWVIWTNRIYSRRAAQLAGDKERLKTLRKMIAEGQVRQAISDLKLSLRAIATLDWEEGVETWGEANIRYRTDAVDLAVWKLAPEFSSKGGIPVLFGVHILKGAWQVAAVRFEVSAGAHWRVISSEPRFLSRGDEVFLDTLPEGSRTFLKVELEGNGTGLEVSMSGLVENKPVAAKHTGSIRLEEE